MKDPDGRGCTLRLSPLTFITPGPKTRAYVRLLGPCFKTGRLRPFRQHPKRGCAVRRCTPTFRRGTACSPAPAASASHFGQPSGPRCDVPRSTRVREGPAVTPPVGGYLPDPRLHPGKPMLTRPPPQVHHAHPLDPQPARLRCDRPRLGRRLAEYGRGTAALNRFPFNDFTCF